MKNTFNIFMAALALKALFLGTCTLLKAVEPNPGEEPKPAIELAVPFTDNMVLQRDCKVPVWGWSKPGTQITVNFAGQTKTTVAVVAPGESVPRAVKWVVKLDPLEASSNPSEMVVTESIRHRNLLEYQVSRAKTLKNILVGEVWFSSGQSNMVWLAGKSMCSELAKGLASSQEDVLIREINVNTVSALYPQHKATSEEGWKKASAASGFSALSLSFAHELYTD